MQRRWKGKGYLACSFIRTCVDAIGELSNSCTSFDRRKKVCSAALVTVISWARCPSSRICSISKYRCRIVLICLRRFPVNFFASFQASLSPVSTAWSMESSTASIPSVKLARKPWRADCSFSSCSAPHKTANCSSNQKSSF